MKLIFESARILRVEHVVKDTTLITHLEMAGQPTEEALELLDIQGTVWEPMKSAALTWQIGPLRVRFTVRQLEQYMLDLPATAAENWRLVRREDDAGPFIELQLRVRITGNPVPVVQSFLTIGKATGRLELIPAQKDLFTQPKETVSVQVPTPAVAVPKEIEREPAH